MAATVSSTSAWAKPGAWALDSEEHEEELKLQKQQDDEKKAYGFRGSAEPEPLADFPSLSTAVASKPKKKKGQTLSLAEFATTTSFSSKSSSAAQSQGLTPEELLVLPTGPRQRTAEELDRSRLGGGFKNYGGGNRYGNNEDSGNPRWGSRVSDENKRGGGFRDLNRDNGPSRADEVDDWGAMKKSSSGLGFERRERGWFGNSQTRADESDNWVSNKPPSFGGFEGRRERSGFGFDGHRERRSAFDSYNRDSSNGVDSDNWMKKKEESNGNGSNGGSVSARPKLVLQPRTLPVNNGSNGSNESASVVKPKGSNPFGEARPREEVLAEKGQDWKKIDEQLESVKIADVRTPKKSFGSGNGRGNLPESLTERSWRKPDSVDSRPQSSGSAEKVEDEPVEDN
ncbi:Plant specific eukaryotic initiation factor 4B [Dillenia turbinata]|uniref:Plant specific eukaryotic initiation factor 4B n=1 Tax=Dillenia turbinata TaxID=194707 RepID=A0AAN8URI9_9MAGN